MLQPTSVQEFPPHAHTFHAAITYRASKTLSFIKTRITQHLRNDLGMRYFSQRNKPKNKIQKKYRMAVAKENFKELF